jgi:hypothetical protein
MADVILLGAAYGVIESGIVDTSAFNHDFEGLDFSLMTIPGLGVSVYWFPYFVFIHAVWSINVPIALVESLVPQRRTKPWLGDTGLASLPCSTSRAPPISVGTYDPRKASASTRRNTPEQPSLRWS